MRGIGAGQRIFDLLERTPAIQSNVGDPVPLSASGTGVVRFENVAFAYPTRKNVKVLSGFDLEIAVGESVAIV